MAMGDLCSSSEEVKKELNFGVDISLLRSYFCLASGVKVMESLRVFEDFIENYEELGRKSQKIQARCIAILVDKVFRHPPRLIYTYIAMEMGNGAIHR